MSPDERRKADTGKSKGGIRALALATAVMAAAFAALFVTHALADYADGNQVRQSGAGLEKAVREWRRAAWQQDDIFSQMELGKLYSGDKSFGADLTVVDPVEGYVWYYLELRPNHLYAVDDEGPAGDRFRLRQRKAFDDMQRDFDSMTLEQRMEARSRIIYILASRGAEGFITLGKLHREYDRAQMGQPAAWPPAVIVKCDDRPEGFLSWFWRWWNREPERQRQRDCHRIRVPWPNADHLRADNDNSWYSQPSVIVRNNDEALMYFDIAANPLYGHPLANDYAESLKNEMSQLGDITNIAADAYSRALTWATPFEFYPGATPGGVPYSDESLPGFAQRLALEHVGEIPPWVVEHALVFRGYLKRPRGPWRPSPPAAMMQAIWKFQDAMRFETTGYLSPFQEVRLIQKSALDGDAEMQNRLGIMYAKGIGVPRNFPRAEYWFVMAAKQNHGEALFNLGVLYKAGPLGVAPNMYKAVTMDLQSAAAGYNPARCELQDLLAKAGIDCHHWARR